MPSRAVSRGGIFVRMKQAIIWDWARTLFDREDNQEFSEAEEVLQYCQSKGYRQAVVSLLTQANSPGTTLKDREEEIASSPLRKYFEMALATDTSKDAAFDQVVKYFGMPRDQVLIIDDRTQRGIKYANKNGHPSIWLKRGKFASELPDDETGQPDYIIHDLKELYDIL